MNDAASLEGLLDAASAHYRVAGRFALHFARNKLKYDPAYRTLLAHGLLRSRARVLDLGCGQGLLAAWLLTAQAHHAAGSPWPAAWPAPPALRTYRGLDINPHEVLRAQRSLGGMQEGFSFEQADIRNAEYGEADAVVMLDVLHYLQPAAQEQVLRRVRAALAPEGLLLLRIGDAAGGVGHHLGRALDQTVALARHGRWIAPACRALADWQQLLGHCGFSSRAVPLGTRGAFVNVMLQAQAA